LIYNVKQLMRLTCGLMEGKREREKKITFVEDNYY
jgi:hypothetical protein